MLKRVKDKIPEMNDKLLVDTFYSIGRLHKIDRSNYPEFFEYLLEDFSKELT